MKTFLHIVTLLLIVCALAFGQMKTKVSSVYNSYADTSDTIGDTTSHPSDSLLEGCTFLLKLPIPIKRVDPVIPNNIRRGINVIVWVKCLVGIDGKVKKAEILKSDGTIFNEAAINAAEQWEFTPAESEVKRVETWTTIPFHFITGK